MDEQQLIAMLKDLPLSITITSRKGEYMWECYASRGSASTLLEALHSALRYLQEPIWQAPPQTDEKADRTMNEQQLIAMLKDLPLSITITSRKEEYIWECYAEPWQCIHLTRSTAQRITLPTGAHLGGSSSDR